MPNSLSISIVYLYLSYIFPLGVISHARCHSPASACSLSFFCVRLKLIEMLSRLINKSDLARPYVESKLSKAKTQIAKVMPSRYQTYDVITMHQAGISLTN